MVDIRQIVEMNNKIYKTYHDLLKKHGDPAQIWPQWCAKKKDKRTREVIAIGAILTQRTSWRNADLALRNLKKEGLLSLREIASLPNLKKLTKLIRVSGFYQTKPKRLYSFALFIVKEYGNLSNFINENVDVARSKLLNLYGIGPETADTILLYALDKPSFIVDEYTKRFVSNHLSLKEKTEYENLKQLFEKDLPKDVRVYQNYHTLIIVEQKGKKDSLMKAV